MTVTRIGQLSAETQNTDDFIIATGSTAPVISATKAKTDTYSYRFSTTTEATGLGLSNQNHVRSHVWLNHNGLTGSARAILLGFQKSGSALNDSHTIVWNNSTTNLEMYVDDTLVASVSVATIGLSTVDTWMSCGAVLKAGSSGYFYFYLNGVEVLSYTGVVGSGNDLVGSFFGGRHSTTGWGSNAYFDDFYVDTLTTETPSAPSSKRFQLLKPNAAGANAQFTPSAGVNYQNLDEYPHDSDTTYNKTLLAGKKDTFEFANVTLLPDHVIRAVIPYVIARKTDAGIDTKVKLHAYDGSTYQESSELVVTTTYGKSFVRLPLQNDGVAWTETDINAYQFGYESAGDF